MTRLGDFFRRNRKQAVGSQQSSRSSLKPESQHLENGSAPVHNNAIASMPAAGMQRSNQGTYITTYNSARLPNTSNRASSDTSSVGDSSTTMVEAGFVSKHGESVWKGATNGKPYDKREELSADDEDMWAKMAM